MAAVEVAGRAAQLEPLEPLGDVRARELYERHADRVLAYCRSRLRRREDAEDAVQTTFLHAVRNLRRGESPSHELAWLLGIARNVCLARIETVGRRGRLELVCDPVDLEASEAPSGRRDELIGLEHALAVLPEQQRRAVLLRDWRGLSYEEVAAQLGVSLANAETLIFRGRRTLAALLDEQPVATRRRLASLGNTGSLLAWAKATFGGAAAASKLAAAVAVVAVSGAGLAVGTDLLDGSASTARAGKTPPVVPSARATGARDTVSQALPARLAPADGPEKPLATPNPAAARPAAAPEAARDTVSQGPPDRPAPTTASAPPTTAAPAAVAPAAPGPTGALPTREQVAESAPAAVGSTVETVADAVEQAAPPLAPVTEAVTETVADAVESLPVPPLPVETPPVVEDVVEAVPPAVAVEPPALLP